MLRKKKNPHKYYIPNGKAEEFIKMVGDNKTFVQRLKDITHYDINIKIQTTSRKRSSRSFR